MSKRSIVSVVLAVAVAASLAGGCARGTQSGAEARLGSPLSEGADRRWGGDRNGGITPGSQADLKASGDDIVYFSSDSSDLTPEARQTIAGQVAWLQRYRDRTVIIEGHADERGTREYNIALGARRAQAVKAFLAAQGIESARLRTTSYGKERPVAICNDISCWSQNRRAQTVLSSAAVSNARY
jgi:peptidoglycan-associated lipoprotein